MKKLSVLIQYAGLELRVCKNDAGDDVTPLKPISDLFGLSWADQHKKLKNSPWLSRFWGVCIGDIPHAGGQKREQICILLQRVNSFLSAINPDRVRAAGNVSGAEYLEQKLVEWADALHDYEVHGEAINQNHIKHREALRRDRMALMSMYNTKNATSDADDRTQITRVIRQASAELGLPYQSDLLDGGND